MSRWLALALLAGCSQGSTAGPPLEALLHGCAERLPPDICEVDGEQTSFTAWVADEAQTDGELSVELDGERLSIETTPVADGVQVRFSVPVQPAALVVRKGEAALRVQLRVVTPQPTLDQAAQLRKQERHAEADALLQSAVDTGEPVVRARALSLLAREAMRLGQAERAVQLLQTSLDANRQAGLRIAETRDRFALAHTHMVQLFDLAAAERALAGTDTTLAQAGGWLQYHLAGLATLQGDVRTALQRARACARRGERIGHRALQTMGGEMQLMQLVEVGRLRDARDLGQQLRRDAADDACTQAQLASNLGWVELRAPEGDREAARDHSQRAASLFAGKCEDHYGQQNARVNLALAHFSLGDLASANDELQRALGLGDASGWIQAWAVEVRARLALAKGDAARALAIFDELSARSEAAAPVTTRYRAALGRGDALVALERHQEAVEAYRLAERHLDADARRVPLAEGRDVFVGTRDGSARGLVDVLLQLGRVDEALRHARLARARSLRTVRLRASLSQRDSAPNPDFQRALGRYRKLRQQLMAAEREAWALPVAELQAFQVGQAELRRRAERALDAAYAAARITPSTGLSEPATGEALLTYHPGRQGWVGFVATAAGVRARRVEAPASADDPAVLAAKLLEPFSPELSGVEQVRVIPYGLLKAVDFHALPFQGEPLLVRKRVVYGNDFAPDSGRDAARGTGAVVIADPRTDLPAAREEGQLVADLLDAPVFVSSQAGRSKVETLLGTADTLHYAGHARFVGRGLRSELLLAGGESLEAGDILLAPRVPSMVILSACETSREGDTKVASVGLAQAFLAAGASSVVATTRPVPDSVGAVLASHLYADGRSPTAERFRRAVLATRDATAAVHPQAWRHYRWLVP